MSGQQHISTVELRLQVLVRRLQAMIGLKMGRPGFQNFPHPQIVSEAQTLRCASAFYEAEQFSRIRACAFGVNLEAELSGLAATEFLETPAERYDLGESILIGGTILTKQARHFLSDMPEWKCLRERVVCHDRATLLNSMQGLRYFGHWLQDDCPLYEAVRNEPVLLSMPGRNWPDRPSYARHFEQDWSPTSFARVGDLTAWRDLGYSRDKARRIRTLRSRLRKGVAGKGDGRPVFIVRGHQGEPRNMSNVEAFEQAMIKAGVKVIQPGQDSEKMIKALIDAPLVIAIEGSQACHGLYTLAEGGSFLILQPPERFYNPLRHWADLLGMNYGIVIGEKDELSFRIDPDEVLRMADRLLGVTRSASVG